MPPRGAMFIHDLKLDECSEVLGRNDVGRLGCARFDQPYVVPIHYAFDAERNCLYSLSAIGRKVEWMRENPKVCVEVEDIKDKNNWITVLAIGRYEELDRVPEHAETRRRAEHLFSRRREWWLPAAGKTGARESLDLVVFRITIDRLTGRRATRSELA